MGVFGGDDWTLLVLVVVFFEERVWVVYLRDLEADRMFLRA